MLNYGHHKTCRQRPTCRRYGQKEPDQMEEDCPNEARKVESYYTNVAYRASSISNDINQIHIELSSKNQCNSEQNDWPKFQKQQQK